jgi:hypothetical protein
MMAKTPRTQDGEGEITFTMVKFGMKGGDPTLQKGLDTIKAAFAAAGFVPTTEPKLLRQNGTKQSPAALSHGTEREEAVDADLVDAEPVDEEAAAPSAKPPRAKPKVKNYVAVPDPGFNTVSPLFKEFATAKNPSSDAKKLLAIAYWFKHNLKQPNVSNELFYTAFREMKWTVPTDIAQNVRELRSARDQRLTKGTDANTSAIALLGENAVDDMGKDS